MEIIGDNGLKSFISSVLLPSFIWIYMLAAVVSIDNKQYEGIQWWC